MSAQHQDEEPGTEPSPELRLHSQGQPPEQLPPGRSWHFNVAFAGASRVGKTKLIQRFTDSQFSDGYAETTETAPVSKAVAIGRHHVLFQCWDTPGAHTLADGLDQRLRFLHAIFIVFDVSRDTSAELERWCRLADACGPPRPLLVLVGNKGDLGAHSDTLARARELGQREGGSLFLLSVLADDENVEVDAMMLEVGKALTERHSLPLLGAHAQQPVGPSGEAATASTAASEESAGDQQQKQQQKKGQKKPGEGPAGRLRELIASWPCCCSCCF